MPGLLLILFLFLFFRTTHDRMFRVSNVDSLILCENKKIERPWRVHLPEMSRRKTHDATFESSADRAKDESD